MLLSEMNPYIRYAHQRYFCPINAFVCAVDYHFYFVLQGGGNIAFDDAVHKLQPNTLVFLPPGTPYYFFNTENLELVDFNFDFTRAFALCAADGVYPVPVHEFDEHRIIERVTFSDAPFLNYGFCLEDISFIKKEAREVVQEFQYKKRFYQETASAILKKIFIMLARYFTACLGQSKIDLVLAHIHTHFNEPLDNTALAELAGYHPVYLNQQVKQITGVSLKQYIINYRMEQAQQLLIYTDQTIAEIAAACGYDSTFYFSGAFRERVGMSPSGYRKRILK